MTKTKGKRKVFIRWTTAWLLNNMAFKQEFYKNKRDLDYSDNHFQIGYRPIKVRITVEEL